MYWWQKKDNINMNIKKQQELAVKLRILIADISYKSKAHHIGSAFSCIDILISLYSNILNYNPNNTNSDDQDWFYLSKGHAALALYVILAEFGYVTKKTLYKKFLVNGQQLGAHPDRFSLPGIELPSGSLGYGLSIGAGVALANKLNNKDHNVFILLGDGECNEGTIWEAAMFASHHNLTNLVAIIDYNHLQGFGTTDEILNLEPLSEKFISFGWSVHKIDGHNYEQLNNTFKNVIKSENGPTMIIAETIKGKGYSKFENKLSSHYQVLNKHSYKEIINELEGKFN